VRLSVTVTAADALLVPLEIVDDDEGAKLKVDALGRSLGGEENIGPVAEVFEDGLAPGGDARAGETTEGAVHRFPFSVDVLLGRAA
jgi:hypothetical protein